MIGAGGTPYRVEGAACLSITAAPLPATAVVAITTSASEAVVETFNLNKFSKGSAKISKANKVKLAAYAATIKAGGYSKITVRSYTSSQNTALASKRAAAVTKLLKKYGVTIDIRNQSTSLKSYFLNNQVKLLVTKS